MRKSWKVSPRNKNAHAFLTKKNKGGKWLRRLKKLKKYRRTQFVNRCTVTGRSRGYLGFFGVSRMVKLRIVLFDKHKITKCES